MDNYCTFCFCSYASSSVREKRLILHSSDDVFNEIQTLKSEIASIKASSDLKIASLKASSDLEIASIKASSDLEIASIKASLDAYRKGKHRFY
jgi:predicted dinucleotide-utilizing enzyme